MLEARSALQMGPANLKEAAIRAERRLFSFA
jgi:hypothetical protein